jgi:hypothetical protein
VRTKLWNTQESKGIIVTEFIDTDNAGTVTVSTPVVHQIYMSEDYNAWVKVPQETMEELAAMQHSTAPVLMSVHRVENEEFLYAYELQLVDTDGNIITDVTSKKMKKGIKVEIAYDTLARKMPAAFAPSSKQQLGLYFFNGVEWIKLGGVNDVVNQQCSVIAQKLGKYAIRFTTLSQQFSLTAIAPRIFTPEESSTVVNRVRFYFENPLNDEVTIRIFDITGAVVRRNLEREGDAVMSWDGCDNNGTIVKGGVYIYQIEAGNKTLNGIIVVAK